MIDYWATLPITGEVLDATRGIVVTAPDSTGSPQAANDNSPIDASSSPPAANDNPQPQGVEQSSHDGNPPPLQATGTDATSTQ